MHHLDVLPCNFPASQRGPLQELKLDFVPRVILAYEILQMKDSCLPIVCSFQSPSPKSRRYAEPSSPLYIKGRAIFCMVNWNHPPAGSFPLVEIWSTGSPLLKFWLKVVSDHPSLPLLMRPDHIIVVFSRFIHTLFGLYLWVGRSLIIKSLIDHVIRWEVVTSLDFDWQFISRRKRFRWPLVSPSISRSFRISCIHIRYFILLEDIVYYLLWSACE